MSENKRMMIQELLPEDLETLTDYQLRVCQRIQLNRVNKRALERMDEILKDQHVELAKALTTPPYVYTSPEIKIMSGCSVRYSTLMKSQLDDAHAQLDHFVSSETPNDIRTTDHINAMLLAHSLTRFNDQDFAGVVFDAIEYQHLLTTSPDKAREMLETVRDERVKALGTLSPQIYQRLVEYYQAFQLSTESLTKSEDMELALGN